MASKSSVLASLDKETYGVAEVKGLIQKVTKHDDVYPLSLKKGDVYSIIIGKKSRPTVIIKVLKDTVLSIPLSTTKDELNLCEYSSRFFGKGYFSASIITSKSEYAHSKFLGVLDNNRCLNNAINEMKQ